MNFELAGQEFGLFYLISQAFALVATLFSLYAFQKRKKIQILNYTVVAAFCSTLHYLFLGAWSGVASKSVGTFRNIFAAHETHRHKTSRIAPFVFIVFYIVTGMITYQTPASILPIIAPSLYTIAIYFGDARRIRHVAVLTSALWLAYNVVVFSVVGIASEAIFILNGLIAIYRYRDHKDHLSAHHDVYRHPSSRPRKNTTKQPRRIKKK